MADQLGDFAEDATVRFGFTTNAADGGRESLSASLEEADIVIFKDGTAMTLDASTITITANPGSRVGVYQVAVDMSNDTDFTTGSDYSALLYPDETVDSQSIAQWLAYWSCENQSVQTVRGAVGSVTAGVNVTQVNSIAQTGNDNGADINTILARLTAARAGYLDNLNVGGNVASSAEATSIQNNTRVVRSVPTVYERPDSGSTAFRLEIFLYDSDGNMEAPDSAPTVAVVNQAGTSRNTNLDSTTMTLVATGHYRSTYTVADSHALEQLMFEFSVVEGGNTRAYGNASLVVDTTAVDFTAADRTLLTDVEARLTAARAGYLDNLNGHVPQTGDSYARLGSPAGASIAADLAALDVLLDSILADTGTDGVELSSAICNKIADHVIRRNSANARASSDGDTVNFRSLLGGVSKLTNRVGVSGTDLLTREEDDSTTFGTQALTTDANADPITDMNTT